jgi:hypothetical protein
MMELSCWSRRWCPLQPTLPRPELRGLSEFVLPACSCLRAMGGMWFCPGSPR